MTAAQSQSDPDEEDRTIDKSYRATACICLLFAFILIIVVVIVMTSRKKTDGSIIMPNSMYDIFLANMDPSHEPCVDFYSYVCGKFAQNHPFAGEWESVGVVNPMIEREHDIALKLKVELEKETSSDETDKALIYARKIFKDCTERIYGELTDRLRWPTVVVCPFIYSSWFFILSDEQLDPRLVNHIKELLAKVDKIEENDVSKLNQLMYDEGINYLMDFYVIMPSKDDTSDRKRLRISSHDWASVLDKEEDTLTFIGQAFTEMNLEKNEIADSSLFQLISKSEYFAKPHLVTSRQLRHYARYNTSNQLYKIGLTLKFISRIFHETSDPRSTHAKFQGLVSLDFEFFNRTNEEFKRHPNSFANLKHLAKLALLIEYGKYYSKSFNSIYWRQIERIGRALVPGQRLRQCIQTIDHYSPLLLTRIYTKQVINYGEIITEVHDILYDGQYSLIDKLNKLINESGWLGREEKKHLLSESKRLSFKLGYPEWVYNDTIFNHRYFQGKWEEGEEFKAFRHLARHKAFALSFHLDVDRISNHEWFDWPISPLSTKYLEDEFHVHGHYVFIPLSLFGDYFFKIGREPVINGATLGSLALQSLMKFFTLPMINQAKNSTNTNLTFSKYEERYKAMMDIYNQVNLNIDGEQIALKDYIKPSEYRPLVFDAAFKFTEHLYFRDRTPALVEDKRFTARKWYFIAQTSQFCSHYSRSALLGAIQAGYIPEHLIFNNIALSFPEFRKEFNCPFHTLPNFHPHRVWVDK